MSGESLAAACDECRHELLLLAGCELSRAEASAKLEAHLAACPDCRDALDAARDVLDELREALRPAPLPAALQRRILRRAEESGAANGRRSAALLRTVPLAAAAGLLATLWVAPPERTPLSQTDAAEIASALGLWQWDDPLGISLERMSDRLGLLQREVTNESQTSGFLPWDAEDEWDAPPREEGPSSLREGRRPRAAPSAGGRGGHASRDTV